MSDVTTMGLDPREGQFAVPVSDVVAGLNAALASEYRAWVLYMTTAHMATGLASDEIREMFLEHAAEEAEHAQLLGRKIVTLGGVPTSVVPAISPPLNLRDCLQQNLELERQALALYNQLIEQCGANAALCNDLQTIASKEAEHAEEIVRLLMDQGDPMPNNPDNHVHVLTTLDEVAEQLEERGLQGISGEIDVIAERVCADAFMKPVVYQGDFYEVETDHDSRYWVDSSDAGNNPDLRSLKDFQPEGIDGEPASFELQKGKWGAYLSAPGYMDRTELSVFDDEKEARCYLMETYDVCPECGEDLPQDDSDTCPDCGEKYPDCWKIGVTER